MADVPANINNSSAEVVKAQPTTAPQLYNNGKPVYDVLAQSKTSETSQVVTDTQKKLDPLKGEFAQAKPAEFVKDSVSEYGNLINTVNAYLAEKDLYGDSQKELGELSTNLAKSIDISKKLSVEKDPKQISNLLQNLISADAKVNESFRKFLVVNKGEDQGFIATIVSKYNNYQLDKVKLPACKKLSDAGLKCPVEDITTNIDILKDEPNTKIDVYQIALLKNMTLLQQTLPRTIYNVNALKSNIDQLAKTDSANALKLREISNRLAWINLQMRDMQTSLQKDGLKVGATYFPTNYISKETATQARKDLDSTFSKTPTGGLTQKTKAIDLALDMDSFKGVLKDPTQLQNLKDLKLLNFEMGNTISIQLTNLIRMIDASVNDWGKKGYVEKSGTYAGTGILPENDPDFARFIKSYAQITDFFDIFPKTFESIPYPIEDGWKKNANAVDKFFHDKIGTILYEKSKALNK